MSKPTLQWFHTLTDGVAALGLAAREYRATSRAAETAAWHVEPARLAPADGTISVPGQYFYNPHEEALTKLGSLHHELADQARKLYENSALAYAYGTAEALKSVLEGQQPQYVQLARRDRLYVLPKASLPDLTDDLGECSGRQRLSDLRERVTRLVRARAAVDDYAFFEDLADHEPSEITEAVQLAGGLADAAYSYGEQVESALLYVLVGSATREGEA